MQLESFPETDDIIRKCIDQIWEQYDEDNSGYLDREETRRFIISTIGEMDEADDDNDDNRDDGFTEEDFEQCFRKVDVDNSGAISKDEMLTFIKLIANLD